MSQEFQMYQHQVQIHEVVIHHIVAIHDSIHDHHLITIHFLADEVEDEEDEAVGKTKI
jgi:hypothetical protein